MHLTEDQVLTLAPDEPSRKAGKDLARPAKWVTRGANEQALWGECQGSGSKPYQTVIDLTNIAFKCSCPSRKFPCKHGIALGLLYAHQADDFTAKEPPAWAAEWISKRAQKEEKKTEKKEPVVDEAAQAKRQQAREQKVADGVEELLTWIRDIIRNGIISMPEKDYTFWDRMAKRLVDAQAPGLAGMVKSLGAIPFFKEGWQSLFLDRLLDLYLVTKGFQNREMLDPLVLQDTRNWIGFTVNQEELKESPGLTDTWLVVGKRVTEEDNLTVERNWLYGIKSNQYALVLQFLIRGQGATILLTPGMYLEAELVYFPSASPLRALIKRQIGTVAVPPRLVYDSWKAVAAAETSVGASFPVRGERPYAVSHVLPVHHAGGWWLKDANDDLVAIREGFPGLWKLLALSGGQPLPMVVSGKEGIYEPLGVWHHEHYKAI